MARLPEDLLKLLRQLLQVLQSLEVEQLIQRLLAEDSADWEKRAQVLLQPLARPAWRSAVSNMLSCWQEQTPDVSSEAIAHTLDALRYAHHQTQADLSLELVWTGPNPNHLPLRRTDQVLLDLIRTAREELWLASFAVYNVPEIAEALKDAIARGVKVWVIAELPESSQAKIAYGPWASLGDELVKQLILLHWPLQKRCRDEQGRHGSLHMKFVIADQQHLLLSSANLTQYALELNMELGVLIHSLAFGQKVSNHIKVLMLAEVLEVTAWHV